MAGKIITVVPQRRLDFSGLGNGNVVDLELAKGIDVSQYRQIMVAVRFYPSTFTSSGSIVVFARHDGRTSEDPGTLFTSTAQLGLATFDLTTTAPYYSTQSLGPNVGPLLRFVARGTMLNRATGTPNMAALVNIDLSLKTS